MSLKDEINIVKRSKKDVEVEEKERMTIVRNNTISTKGKAMIKKLKKQLLEDANKGKAVNDVLSGRLEFTEITGNDDNASDGWGWFGVDIRPQLKIETVKEYKKFSFTKYDFVQQLSFSLHKDILDVFDYLKTYADSEKITLGKLYLYNSKTKSYYKDLTPIIKNQDEVLYAAHFVYAVDYSINL